MATTVKKEIPSCVISMVLSCQNFRSCNSEALNYCLEANIFSSLKLTSVKNIEQAQKFLKKIVELNPYLKEFRYPKSQDLKTNSILEQLSDSLKYAQIKPIQSI